MSTDDRIEGNIPARDDDDNDNEENEFGIDPISSSSSFSTSLSQTFRQRRLTVTSSQLNAAAALAAAEFDLSSSGEDDDEEEKEDNKLEEDIASADKAVSANQHNKISSSLVELDSANRKTNKKRDIVSVEHSSDSAGGVGVIIPPPRTQQSNKKRRTPSFKSLLVPKIHCSQQMKLEICRYCPKMHSDLTPLPNGSAIVMTHYDSASKSLIDDNMLPFPREVLGTYSCHGIEPIYDDSCCDEEGENEHDNDGDEINKNNGPSFVAKINQDRGVVAQPFGSCPRTALFGVFDGHGERGEVVAQYTATEFQKRLMKHELFQKDISEASRQTFVSVDSSLEDEKDIDPVYSGTTACVVLLRDNKLIVSNVGDSRAVICQRNTSSSVVEAKINNGTDEGRNTSSSTCFTSHIAKDLTIDQNPDSPGEKERIEACGGFVSPPPEEGLSARVWLDKDCTQVGLAMSRSIGDHAVKRVGVISEPVVTMHDIDPNVDDYLIVASDGVWEFVESQTAVEIVSKCFENGEGASKACKLLIEVAAAKWHEYEGDYRDDITALVIQLNGLWS